jgi:hypothetical protein
MCLNAKFEKYVETVRAMLMQAMGLSIRQVRSSTFAVVVVLTLEQVAVVCAGQPASVRTTP